MSTRLLLPILLLLVLLIFTELFLVFQPFKTSRSRPAPTSQAQGDWFDPATKHYVALGFVQVPPSKGSATLIAQLDGVSQSQDGVYATLRLSKTDPSGRTIKVLVALPNLHTKFALGTRSSKTVEVTKGRETYALLDSSVTLQRLQQLVGKEGVFTFLLGPEKATSLSPDQKRLSDSLSPDVTCNQTLIDQLQAGAINELSCVPFTGQLSIYEGK